MWISRKALKSQKLSHLWILGGGGEKKGEISVEELQHLHGAKAKFEYNPTAVEQNAKAGRITFWDRFQSSSVTDDHTAQVGHL